MRRSSGNQGDGRSAAMHNDVNDSHHALTQLIGAARDAFGDELSPREQAGLVRFEQAVARRTLRAGARVRAWAFGFGLGRRGRRRRVRDVPRGPTPR